MAEYSKRQSLRYDNFPFEKLRIGSRTKGCASSAYGDVHLSTFIENNNNLEDYEIIFPEMKSPSIAYYIDKDGNNLMNPSFYLHPIVHARWGEKDKDGNDIRTQSGKALDEFNIKFVNALNTQLSKLSPSDKAFIMGSKFVDATKHSEFIEPISKFSKYPDSHPTMARLENKEKSPSMAMSLWAQDITKRTEKADNKSTNKKKYANLGKTNDLKPNVANNDQNFMVPNTNTIIYTKIYNVIKPKNGNISDEQRKNKIIDYNLVKKFIHNTQGHPNASESMADLIIQPTVLGPSIRFLPAKSNEGNIQFRINDLKIGGYNSRTRSTGLTDDVVQVIDKNMELAKAELGFEDCDDEEDYQESLKKKEDNELIERKALLARLDIEIAKKRQREDNNNGFNSGDDSNESQYKKQKNDDYDQDYEYGIDNYVNSDDNVY